MYCDLDIDAREKKKRCDFGKMYTAIFPQEIRSRQFWNPFLSMFGPQNSSARGKTDKWSSLRWSIPNPVSSKVKVELYNEKLWQRFHDETTEMIITKSGRRMFPTIQLMISGLDAEAYYNIIMEITLASPHRLKYCQDALQNNNDRGWTVAGPAELQPHTDNRIYLHPDNPAVGAHWMANPVNFNKLKLTNNAIEHRHNVVLTSMHKYIPKIWIIRCDNYGKSINGHYSSPSFIFKETEFIAVTAYQNENITKMKIENNPFAKGFREAGRSRCKSKSRYSTRIKIEEEDDDDDSSCKNESINSTNDTDTSSTVSKTQIQTENIDDACDSTALTEMSSSEHSDDHETPVRFHRPWLKTYTCTGHNEASTSTSVSSSSTMYGTKTFFNTKEISDMQNINAMNSIYAMKMRDLHSPILAPNHEYMYPYHTKFDS